MVLDKLSTNQSTKMFDMNRKQFDKLLHWTCKSGTLQFNGKFYKQIDGIAIGSPLAPALADFCMNWLLDEVASKLQYLSRFFVLWMRFSWLLTNPMIQKLQFTNEPEHQNQIAFLDVHITKTDKGSVTKIYRKPTITGLYMKWESYEPLRYKKNLVFTLLDVPLRSAIATLVSTKNFSEF